MEKIKLTQHSHAAGCGCKIAPGILEEILQGSKTNHRDKNLIVGNESGDDAAVLDLENGTALISTTDFFMPIVDDAFDFGRIAAANAISDVYAMGGKPVMALAILGWPVEKLPIELCRQVLEGARTICKQANITLAGGHSIDSTEPLFGLAVNGLVEKEKIKRNNTAKTGNLIYLTKPLGTGILATALKRNLIDENQMQAAVNWMCTLNSFGAQLAECNYVTSLTDITGFGLLGHLIEMAEGSKLSALIQYESIQLIDGVKELAAKFISPDNTFRNWKNMEPKVGSIEAEPLIVLCDPQTSGGLLIAVDSAHQYEFEKLMIENNLQQFSKPIGSFVPIQEKYISII